MSVSQSYTVTRDVLSNIATVFNLTSPSHTPLAHVYPHLHFAVTLNFVHTLLAIAAATATATIVTAAISAVTDTAAKPDSTQPTCRPTTPPRLRACETRVRVVRESAS
jgi:hypothetical protein